ncbi:hypothetical protein [Halalkalibacter oceani]|uniref:hypothetical protein n=1 Tax=Halalkalibacter oceani TaxID=1653776 RepID=UPI0033984BEB
MLRGFSRFLFMIPIFSLLSACYIEETPSRADFRDYPQFFAQYVPVEYEGIHVTIDFHIDNPDEDDLTNSYGHMKIFVDNTKTNLDVSKEENIHYEVKGTDIKGEFSQRMRATLTDMPEELLNKIDSKQAITVLIHLNDDFSKEIELQHIMPSRNMSY